MNNVPADNSFLSYYLAFVIASVGLQNAVGLDEKQVLFDAAATFYCRALTKGNQNIPSDVMIENASDGFNQVEDWLIKWRHNVVMHEFCVQRGFLLSPTEDYADIFTYKYIIDSIDSVKERLQVARDFSSYRMKYIKNETVDVSKYTVIPSEPRTEKLKIRVLTVQSLVSKEGADLEECKTTFKLLWSLLLIIDMLNDAIICIDKYQSSVVTEASQLSPEEKTKKKVFEIAYLLKAVNLLYATSSPSHLTYQLSVSNLVQSIRAGGGHGGVPDGYFEWSKSELDTSKHDDIIHHLFENIELPSNNNVEIIKAEAVELRTSIQCLACIEKQKLKAVIDLRESSRSDVGIPVGLSRIYLNGPGSAKNKTTVQQSSQDVIGYDEDIFSIFE